MNGLSRIKHVLSAMSLAMSVALAPAWAAEEQPDHGMVKVADVLEVNHRLGDGADVSRVVLDYPGASFLRVHLTADVLPADARVLLQGKNGQVQQIDAAEILEGGEHGFYAMSMDTDTVDVIVRDTHGQEAKHGYVLRIDGVDVGFAATKEAGLARSLAVIGADQRRPAVCYQSSEPGPYRRAQAVARSYSNGWLGTAWRVGSENRMLTNHHVMGNDANAGDYELWFGYEHQSCGGGATKAGVKVRGGTRLVGDAGLDFQLFTIRDSDFERIRGFGHLGLDVGNLAPGEVIYIPQHGAGQPKQLALYVDGGDRCRIAGTPGTLGQYQCDTEGGSSGSPVIRANTGRAVVLHNSASGSRNQGNRINQIWPRIQPYFANGAVPQTSP